MVTKCIVSVRLAGKHYLNVSLQAHHIFHMHFTDSATVPRKASQMSKSLKTLCQQLYLTVLCSPPTLINSPAVLTLGKWNVRFVAVILMGRCCAKS